MEAINLGEAKMEEQPIRAVLYGEAGAGKTYLMREFPKPLLLYDFDGKYEPLVGVEGVFVKSFRRGTIKESKQMWLDFWREWQKDRKDPQWKTLVIDSLTALDTTLVDAIMYMLGYDPEKRDTYKKNVMTVYGELKKVYATLFDSIRACDHVNVIVLAHEKMKENKDGVLLRVSPLISGSTQDSICATFKDTWYLELKGSGVNAKRFLHYSKYKMRSCTSSMMNGTGVIENPTYQKIIAEQLNRK